MAPASKIRPSKKKAKSQSTAVGEPETEEARPIESEPLFRRGKGKNATGVGDTLPARTIRDKEKVQENIKKYKAINPAGVRFADDFDNQEVLGGYLHFSKKREFYQWAFDDDSEILGALQIWERWYQLGYDNFKGAKQARPMQWFDVLNDFVIAGKFTEADTKLTRQGRSRATIYSIGHSTESLNRAYTLFQYFHKNHTTLLNADPKGKLHWTETTEPIWLPTAGADATPEVEEATSQAEPGLSDEAKAWYALAKFRDQKSTERDWKATQMLGMTRPQGEIDTISSAARMDLITDAFEAAVGSQRFRSTNINRPGRMRPLLDLANMRAICDFNYSRTTQLWPRKRLDLSSNATSGTVDSSAIESLQMAVTENEAYGQDEAENLEATERERFWKHQRTFNATSAPLHDYETACARLNCDPRNPVVDSNCEFVPPSSGPLQQEASNFRLFPWQVTGIEWMVKMDRSPLKGFLCADDMGLGKTIEAIVFNHTRPRKVPLRKVNRSHINRGTHGGGIEASDGTDSALTMGYKPTLVVTPANAVGVWRDEYTSHAAFSSIKVALWMGTTKDKSALPIIGSKAQDLIKWVRALDQDSPQTARTVVITSYSTLAARSLYQDQERARSASPNDGEESLDPEELKLRATRSWLPGVFGRVICDEAHTLRHTITQSHYAVKLLGAESVCLLTGTPMVTKPADLEGLLSLLWRGRSSIPVRSAHSAEDDGVGLSSLDIYEQASKFMKKAKNRGNVAAVMETFPNLLNPFVFSDLALPKDGGQIDPAQAKTLVQPILKLIQMRRTMASTMKVDGKQITIGDTLKPYRAVTVELQMSPKQYIAYFKKHETLTDKLFCGKSNGKRKHGMMNNGKHRRLSHCTLNPMMDDMTMRMKVDDVDNLVHTWEDYGASLYLMRTLPFSLTDLSIYADRRDLINYMCSSSPKLQHLLGLLKQICLDLNKKVLLFFEWPCTLWYAESVLTNVGFKCMTIKAEHSAAEREKIARAFNDPESEVQVLLTSTRTSAASINLQKDCHFVVFVDIPSSFGMWLQCVHRLFRIGQKEQVLVITLTVTHTYDETILNRQAVRQKGVMGAQANITVTEEEVRAAMEGKPNAKFKAIKAKLFDEKCGDAHRQMMGMRSSRAEWTNYRNLDEKDALAIEKEFRQSLLDDGVKLCWPPIKLTDKAVQESFGDIEEEEDQEEDEEEGSEEGQEEGQEEDEEEENAVDTRDDYSQGGVPEADDEASKSSKEDLPGSPTEDEAQKSGYESETSEHDDESKDHSTREDSPVPSTSAPAKASTKGRKRDASKAIKKGIARSSAEPSSKGAAKVQQKATNKTTKGSAKSPAKTEQGRTSSSSNQQPGANKAGDQASSREPSEADSIEKPPAKKKRVQAPGASSSNGKQRRAKRN